MLTYTYYYHAGIECVCVRKDNEIIFDGPVEDWFDTELSEDENLPL